MAFPQIFRGHNYFLYTKYAVLPLSLLLVLGLAGCGGGHWHSHDPAERRERAEKHLQHAREEVVEELNLQPHQEPGLDALLETFRGMAHGWIDDSEATGKRVKALLAPEAPDADAIAAEAKAWLMARPSKEDLAALMDQAVAFYKTLDAEQQQVVLKKLRKHIDRRF